MNRATNDLISRTEAKDFVRSERGAELLKHFPLNAIIVLKLIDELPAVDAAPVVHSQWKQTDAYPHWLYCQNCYKRIVPNVEWIEEYNIPTSYCPNCGAKMETKNEQIICTS